MENMKKRALELLVVYGFNFVGAILVLMIGFAIVNMVIRTLDKTLTRGKIDMSLHSFIKSISSFTLKALIAIIAATMIGIPPTTFIAVLSAAGLAIGLALRDSLANFAGGVLILVFRPFNVGDFIDISGYSGTVKEIQLLYTALNTPDNRRITIPNGELANGKITNYSVEQNRRLDLVFGVSYDDDIVKVKQALTSVVAGHSQSFKDPEPVIRVTAYEDSSVKLTIKVWCKREDYWNLYYDLQEQIKAEFDKEGITIPFPQREVGVYNIE